ncbi:MAG: C2H2-type zinc finger protein, partial [Nitrososphaerales archaeon]
MQDEEEGKPDFEGNQEPITEPVTEATTEKAEYICDVCGKVFDNENSLLMHRLRSHKLPTKEGGVGVEAPKPPEVETIEEAIAFIKERLTQVYGVGKNDRIIVKALEDDPTPLRDGNLLHAFIKSLAPRAYDAHLSTSVIKPLYVRFPNLAQAVDKYLGGTQPQQAPYAYQPSPQQTYGYTFYYPSPTYPPSYPFYPPSTYAQPYPHFAYQPKPPKTYKIVVEGQEIETDESGFMAWQRFLREKE